MNLKKSGQNPVRKITGILMAGIIAVSLTLAPSISFAGSLETEPASEEAAAQSETGSLENCASDTEQEETLSTQTTIVSSGDCGNGDYYSYDNEWGNGWYYVCNSDLTYSLDNAGNLRISGTGEMYDSSFYCEDNNGEIRGGYYGMPWSGYYVKSVIIEEGVKNISGRAFYNCKNIKSIQLPSSLEDIGEEAFKNCKSLESIVIPESVEDLDGWGIFYGCENLRSINLPKEMTNINDELFYNCKKLKSIIIPDGVYMIGMEAFKGCSSLSSVYIPIGVTAISYGAFYGCSSLKTIKIPESVTSIDSNVFTNSGMLKAKSKALGKKKVKVYWNKVKGAYKYTVYHYVKKGSKWKYVNKTTTKKCYVKNSKLKKKSRHMYRVRAYCKLNYAYFNFISPYSNQVKVK